MRKADSALLTLTRGLRYCTHGSGALDTSSAQLKFYGKIEYLKERKKKRHRGDKREEGGEVRRGRRERKPGQRRREEVGRKGRSAVQKKKKTIYMQKKKFVSEENLNKILKIKM